MPPRRGGICGRFTAELPSNPLQGDLALEPLADLGERVAESDEDVPQLVRVDLAGVLEKRRRMGQ